MTLSADRVPRRRLAAVLTATLTVALLPGPRASAQSPSPVPATAAACTGAPGERFTDVSGAHADAIDCVNWWGIAHGTGADRFTPTAPIRRDQMAAFVARSMAASGTVLPSPVANAFADDDGTVHEAAIDRLADLGVVGGIAPGAYGPGRAVTRAQMASFLVRAWRARTGTVLPRGGDRFVDDDGTTHEDSIDRAAAAGLVSGVDTGRFSPADPVSRAQMATFLARFLARLIDEGHSATPVPGTAPGSVRDGWMLRRAESFDELPQTPAWRRDDRSDQLGPFDDDGVAFHVKGGPVFAAALASFDTYRASFRFGQDDWLTAELATRDPDGSAGPAIRRQVLPNGRTVGRFVLPANTDGAIIRSSQPLPDRYRIEYELTTLDFGGPRAGVWDYDGLRNGYRPEGCKTQHPWTTSRGQPTSAAPCDFADVRGENGFYFLSILDHAAPMPRNNVFIHDRRKVVIDQYQVSRPNGASYRVCDPATGETYSHHDPRSGNGVPINMLFLTDDNQRNTGFVSNEFLMETDCGFFFGGDADTTIVSAAELRPALLPGTAYRFAVERTATGYVLEVAGDFLHGPDTLRYERQFVQDGHPIWHYNQRADDYAGQFNRRHTIAGPYGRHDMGGLWPAGSAYPDAFVIGIPHTNFYEGSASIDDLRLYVPADGAG